MNHFDRVNAVGKWIRPIYYVIMIALFAGMSLLIVDGMKYDLDSEQPVSPVRQAHAIIFLVGIPIRIAASVLMLVWFYRAYLYFAQSNPDVAETTPGMAVGVFFIPILNLYRPYRHMNEIYSWHAFEDQTISDTTLVGWWWALVITTSLLPRVFMGLEPGPTERYVSATLEGLDIVLFVVELTLINRITAWTGRRVEAESVTGLAA